MQKYNLIDTANIPGKGHKIKTAESIDGSIII